jgi:hypothetical protein
MPIFRYRKNIQVQDEEDIILKIKLIDPGSAAHHLIDIPGPNDKDAINACTVKLGQGIDLKKERTLIFSSPVNIDPNTNEIQLDYYINDSLIQHHSNSKTVDVSPQIILTLNFENKV